ncbi:MAG TPA: hypothetical protein VGG84_08310 [Gemmatimonadaceae bacterium]|jgi:hypothetical protein
MAPPEESAPTDLTLEGAAVAYRLFDIGYAIELEAAAALLAPIGPARTRPARGEAQAIQIANPPVAVSLGARDLLIGGVRCRAQLAARLFDFGVCSVQLDVQAPEHARWNDFVAFAREVEYSREVAQLMNEELARLRERIASAIERPGLAPVTEEYVVFRISALRDERGAVASPDSLTDERLALLLLGEQRPLAREARRSLLSHRFSYYADDLVVLTWDNALVVEPSSNDRDVEYILEFANAQLLELRVYDELLDAQLPAMYDRIAAVRRRQLPPTRRFRSVLADLQTRVADVTETVERAENGLKVTDDVYLARVYGAALELFRATAWRRGIERKLEIFRETYAMLNGEGQAARSELLEIVIIVVILAELVLGIVRAR